MKTKRKDKFFNRLRDGLYYAFKKKSWGDLHAFFEQQLGGGTAGKATINQQLKEYRSWVHIATSAIYRRVSQIDYKFYRDDIRMTLDYQEDYDFFDAEHYGYNHFTNPVTHRRQIIFDKRDSCFFIRDILSGDGKHLFEIYFHL